MLKNWLFRTAVLVIGLTLTSTVVVAQAPKKPVDPIIEEVSKSLSPEGIQERQLRAIKALAEAYEAAKAKLQIPAGEDE